MGEVRQDTRKSKKPEERCLTSNPSTTFSDRYIWIYDFQGAVKKARKDWGASNGKEAAEMAERDFKYIQDWLEDIWFYIGIVVTEGKEVEGEFIKDENLSKSLWGIESEGDLSFYIQDLIGDTESYSNKVGETK